MIWMTGSLDAKIVRKKQCCPQRQVGWSWALKKRIFSYDGRTKYFKKEGNFLARYLFY